MADEKKYSGYKPDYSQKCDNCDNSPTVVVKKDGETVEDYGLCGPCVFGSAECLDPDNW